MSGVEVRRVAERALLVRFADAALEVAVSRAQALAERVSARPPARLAERVLGAGNLLLRFAEPPPEGWEALAAAIEKLARATGAGGDGATAAREIVVGVEFGGEAGPDLGAVGRALGLSGERVVELFAGASYRVAFVGFAPGFPYLIGLPRELELPRLASPRPRVPPGSVAIAGAFAGIYPWTTPGGWHLLGRTEEALFDPAADPPARLAPGDVVRFVARGRAPE